MLFAALRQLVEYYLRTFDLRIKILDCLKTPKIKAKKFFAALTYLFLLDLQASSNHETSSAVLTLLCAILFSREIYRQYTFLARNFTASIDETTRFITKISCNLCIRKY